MDAAAIFLKILNMSFSGAVVICIILFVRLLYHMLPKKYLCILWYIALIRLLYPFTFPELGVGQAIQEPIPSNIMEVQQPYIASEIEVIDQAVNNVLEHSFTPDPGDSANPLQTVVPVAAIIWISGMAVMLIYTMWNLHRFYQWIREAVPEKELGNRIYRCRVEMPVVAGIFTPKIYLPYGVEEPQLTHVLHHERMHIQRKDHLLKILFYIAVIIHWFNPFVWIAYRLLERDMEMACDEAVLEKLGTKERMNYCESLLAMETSKNHFVGNPVAFGESDVKVRIKNLLNYKKPAFWLSVIAVIVILYTAIRCLNGPAEGKIDETDNEVQTTAVNSTVSSEMAAKDFMLHMFTSIPGRYEGFLESGDDFPYLEQIADRVTERCLQYMEEQGYYTLVDEYADQAGVQIRFVNVVLTDVINGDKDVADYLYTATLTKEKDGETKEFTVEGEICVVNMLNNWKVDSFKIDDIEAPGESD